MSVQKIESTSNKIYKKLLSLTKSKGIDEHLFCLVSGDKVVKELFATNKIDVENSFWVTDDPDHELLELKNLPSTIHLSKPLFKEIDICGTHKPILATPLPSFDDWEPEDPIQGHELLCALGDPNNLGALIRSATAFNISKIILLEEACHPFHPKVIKSSAGAVFNMPLYEGPSIQSLSRADDLYALDAKGTPLKELDIAEPIRVLLGEEGQGIPADVKTKKISVPINKNVESLNATVAASVLFYELSK